MSTQYCRQRIYAYFTQGDALMRLPDDSCAADVDEMISSMQRDEAEKIVNADEYLMRPSFLSKVGYLIEKYWNGNSRIVHGYWGRRAENLALDRFSALQRAQR